MKRGFKAVQTVFLSIVLSLTGSLSVPICSLAAENESNDFVFERVQEELDSLNEQYSPKVFISLDDTLFTNEFADQIISMDDEQLHCYLESIYTTQVQNSNSVQLVQSIEEPMRFSSSARAANGDTWTEFTTVSKECSVSSAIPSIGICWINIPYTASMKKLSSNGVWYIDTIDVGWSYQTGLGVAGWSQSSSSVEKGQYETYANITVTGVLSYGLYGTPLQIQTQQSFLYTLRADEIME
ncbi:MAG: hypothetical protein IKZ94_00140 [Lachnospiraceae bacterium]|nr:hypothetical protein [Lachnospiraceae bacterium]